MQVNISVVWWRLSWLVSHERLHWTQESGLCNMSNYKCINGWLDFSFEGRWKIHYTKTSLKRETRESRAFCLCFSALLFTCTKRLNVFTWNYAKTYQIFIFYNLSIWKTQRAGWVKSSLPQELAFSVSSTQMAYPFTQDPPAGVRGSPRHQRKPSLSSWPLLWPPTFHLSLWLVYSCDR